MPTHSNFQRFWFATLMLAFVVRTASFAAEVTPGDGDPGLALQAPVLSADEEKLVRGWFKELGSDDFDTREAALSKIMGKGPPALRVAKEFVNDPDPEIAANAKGLRSKILLKFDGFLPTDPALAEALSKSPKGAIKWSKDSNNTVQPIQTLIEICKANGIKLEFDNSGVSSAAALPGDQFPGNGDIALQQTSLKNCLEMIARFANARAIPRGDTLLITSDANAKRLATQRYTFDWSSLELSRDEAARVEKEFIPFFAVDTELHSGSSALVITGTEHAIQRAARLIALLQRNAPSAVWPRNVLADDDAMLSKLSARTTVQISSDSPSNIVQTLQEKKHDVVVLDFTGNVPGANWPQADMAGMSTLNLNFNQGAPLGLVMRWCERRAKLLNELRLVYTLSPTDQIGLQLQFGTGTQTLSVGGADVAFLYAAPHEFNEKTDAAARKQLLDAIEPQLELFPALNAEAHFRVVRGRLLMEGYPATLRRILRLVSDWKSTGKPPAVPEWQTALENAVSTEVDWDGSGLSAGKILGVLRHLGKVNIFLEDSPTSAVDFRMSPQEAQLLPPGRYPFKKLLDDLAARTKAQWKIDLGAIVITPK